MGTSEIMLQFLRWRKSQQGRESCSSNVTQWNWSFDFSTLTAFDLILTMIIALELPHPYVQMEATKF